MTITPPIWLPKLVELSDYQGDFLAYIEAVYSHFRVDFVDSTPVFDSTPFKLKRHPMDQGKEATFWHLTTTGKDEATRENDLRRVLLWFERLSYLVVLSKRKGYFLLWTAYPVDYGHSRRKLNARYEKYGKK